MEELPISKRNGNTGLLTQSMIIATIGPMDMVWFLIKIHGNLGLKKTRFEIVIPDDTHEVEAAVLGLARVDDSVHRHPGKKEKIATGIVTIEIGSTRSEIGGDEWKGIPMHTDLGLYVISVGVRRSENSDTPWFQVSGPLSILRVGVVGEQSTFVASAESNCINIASSG